MSQTIEIRNTGPIHRLSIPIPEEGGVVVLRARNGRGKSVSLAAAEALIGRDAALRPRDGAPRGEVSGFGAKLTVTKRMTRSGELEVETLDGRMNVADLVDPGLVDPDRADAARIKALVHLAGVEPDADLFRQKFAEHGVEFDDVASPNAVECDDVLKMAAVLKRDCERVARDEAKAAEVAEQVVRVATEAIDGLDLSVESDPAILQSALEEAISRQTSLRDRATAAKESAERLAVARAFLAEARRPNLQEFEASLLDAEQQRTIRQKTLAEARQALAEAKRAEMQARRDLDAAVAVEERCRIGYESAGREMEAIANSERVVADSVAEPPSDEEVIGAQTAVIVARQAIERAAVVRQAMAKRDKAQVYRKDALRHRKAEQAAWNAASSVDDVLSSLVSRPGCPLRVESGRLVLTTARGNTLFADLSEGERWKVALDIAIDAIGPHGLLVIPQPAFESLDPVNRRLISEHVRSRGVTVLTAEASDDEQVVAEVM